MNVEPSSHPAVARVSPEAFCEALARTRSRMKPHAAQCVTMFAPGELQGYACYLSGDDLAGFAVGPDGLIVGLFSGAPGRGAGMVAAAVSLGGDYLQCFDGFLAAFYAICGFVEEARFHWDPNLAPGDWQGPPRDYLTMRHVGQSLDVPPGAREFSYLNTGSVAS